MQISKSAQRLLRSFIIELVVYGLLLVIYFLLVLRFLGDPLNSLFEMNLTFYAFSGLGLIMAQSVLLDAITSFLIKLLGIELID